MKITIDGQEIHVATGGKDFDASLPVVIFLHGSGLDHRSWALQTRWFAFHGFAVLAPCFPGHSLSAGSAIATIEDSAVWLDRLMDGFGVQKAHVVGHSQGFLSALELARQFPVRVASLIGIATAASIPVNTDLLNTAKSSAATAAEFMLKWGFGPKILTGVSPTPGMQPIAIGHRIMATNPLATDLQACASYAGGDIAAKSIQAPSKLILSDLDKMTPLKAGQALAKLLKSDLSVLSGFGHMLPMEAPKEVLSLTREFILRTEGQTL